MINPVLNYFIVFVVYLFALYNIDGPGIWLVGLLVGFYMGYSRIRFRAAMTLYIVVIIIYSTI